MAAPSSAFQQYGYSVVHTHCLSNLSHIHELGHNFGADHDRANAQSTKPFSYAYRNCDDNNKPFRTIMAYSTGCSAAPRVPIFSNPDELYEGMKQGSDVENNARVLNEAMATVVNFRDSLSPSPSRSPSPQPAPQPNPVPASTGSTGSIWPAPIPGKEMKSRGCFKDDVGSRVMEAGTNMPAISGKSIGMTRANCLAYCHAHAKQYTFFGVEFGRECFCSDSKSDYKRLGKSSQCNMKCAGDSSTTCGGQLAIEVFRIKDGKSRDESMSVLGYQGCYRDVASARGTIHSEPMDANNASLEVCDALCTNANYSFYAVKYGYMCSCGNALPDESTKVEDSQCSTPCASGNTDEYCGGEWHRAFYSVSA